ncbi:MAG: DUF4349 domain-containing protein [Ignavibacteria bacterium]|nr:DUF4349 domain-containing protein [Ignavibacteriota bacterium]
MKTRIIYFVLPVLLAVIIWGCEKKSEQTVAFQDKNVDPYRNEEKVMNSPSLSMEKVTNKVSETEDKIPDAKDQRMIIKTGSLSIEIDKFDDAETKINDIVKKYSGFISNSKSTVNSSGNKSGTITVKVPADKYDVLTAEVTKIGKVMSQNIQANDVTEEYVDLESRLKTQKELEQRLIKLLNEKASRLTEVIEVEEKLASVRQKIESFEGKMKLLKSQSDLSTLTISVYEPSMISTSTGGGFFYELGQAVKKGLSGFTNVLAVSITFIIAIIPLAGFALIIFWIIRKIIRKRKSYKEVLK